MENIKKNIITGVSTIVICYIASKLDLFNFFIIYFLLRILIELGWK